MRKDIGFKQVNLKLIHGQGFDYNAKLVFRTQIYENILKGIAGLLNGKRDLRLQWRCTYTDYGKIFPLSFL